MAQKQALRDLQSRVAERLKAASEQPRTLSWLAFECAGLGLLTPLPSAGEIFSVGTVLPVPHTQPWFMGVANLRGGLHGVVDLSAFLGLRPPVAVDSLREQARIVAFNPSQGAHCAVIVDRLAGLRNPGQMTRQAADDEQPPAFVGPLWRDGAGREWQEIDLLVLARHEQFLAIAR
jgi:twitching motility protein PilI